MEKEKAAAEVAMAEELSRVLLEEKKAEIEQEELLKMQQQLRNRLEHEKNQVKILRQRFHIFFYTFCTLSIYMLLNFKIPVKYLLFEEG